MWSQIYSQVLEAADSLGSDLVYYRGQADASWYLLPGLARVDRSTVIERISYFDFVTRAGDLLPEMSSSWNTLFAMQHHGLPTRLLDWTETFAVALYFALKGTSRDAAVWLLNPFELNRHTYQENALLRPTDLGHSYYDFFIAEEQTLGAPVVAISPLRHNPRLNRQRGGFTLHGDLTRPLEELAPSVLRKIVIPVEVQKEAREFLKMAGVSEFTLFPDLDGLARELRDEHF